MEIRVLVHDECTLMAAGIRSMLAMESGLVLVDTATSNACSPESRGARRPDVIVVDSLEAAIKVVSGMRREEAADADGPGVIALVARDDSDEERVLEGIKSGLRGVVDRHGAAADLVSAIRAVASGYVWFVPVVMERVVRWALSAAPLPLPSAPVGVLSETERVVLDCLAKGMLSSEISRQLGITEATVRSHVHHTLTKLGLRNRAQAVAFAYKYGLVGP